MVAPNGARPMKKDHAAVPITINEIVKTGEACFEAGAEAIHFHTRNNKGEHVLDSGLCKETLSELQKKVPKMHLQIQLKQLENILLKKCESLLTMLCLLVFQLA